MKIETNTIGNYTPFKLNNLNKTAAAQPQGKTVNVTNEEKEFFSKLYPQNKNEIMDYHFYRSSGKMSGVSVGSLFDKRG